MPECAPGQLLNLAIESNHPAVIASPRGPGPAIGSDAGPLCAAAIREGLGGIFHRRIQAGADRFQVSHELAELLRQIYYAGVQKNLRLLSELAEILERVNAAKIKIVMLQGISLLDHAYTDIGMRALTDMDLWVLPRDFDRFADCMQRLGYRPRNHYPQTFIRGDTIVDVHTHLLWADRIKSRDSLLRVDQEIIYNSAEPLTVENQTTYRLARADQFVYLCLHILKHSAQRLIWLVDIVQLIRDWESDDWRQLHQRASQLGQLKSVQYIFFMLADLTDLDLPDFCRDMFAAPPLKSWEKTVLRLRRKKDQLPVWVPLLLLPAGLSPARKSRFIFENLFPAPEVLRQVFSQRTHLRNWQLYGLRVLQLLGLIKAD